MPDKLHIDIETYSSVDIKTAGHYKYIESPDFEILILCYALNYGPVKEIDMTELEADNWDEALSEFLHYYNDPAVQKWAHNATFERNAFKRIGLERPIEEWWCSAIQSAYCGYPLSLGAVSSAMGLGDKSKLSTGKALIRYFSMPCKATKVNGGRTRNLPEHDPEKWQQFIEYCAMDVEAEREITDRLKKYTYPEFERQMYILDQEINDRGIQIDTDMARTAVKIVKKNAEVLGGQIKEITGVDNPNSPAQLKEWLGAAMKREIKSLAKGVIPKLIEEAESEAVLVSNISELKEEYRQWKNARDFYTQSEQDGFLEDKGYEWSKFTGEKAQWAKDDKIFTSGSHDIITNKAEELGKAVMRSNIIDPIQIKKVPEVLKLRTKASKTSNKKYNAMLKCVGKDGRGRGFFQHYGANRTGRWAGRIVQLQNLPRNYIKDLDLAREVYKEGDYEIISMFFDNVPDVLSQLIRTTFVAKEGHTFAVADFSAIEARVIAWLANEKWRLEVFNSHGKIYEASAAMMFNVPIEQVTKGSEWRQKGKVAELACIAEDQPVLTNSGLKAIQDISLEDKLWDGLNWVSHEGVIFKGYKNVISYGGLTATEDHKVWTEGKQEPIQFGESAASGSRLLQTGDGRRNIRLGENNISGEAVEGKLAEPECTDRVYSVQEPTVDESEQPKERQVKRVPAVFPTQANTTMARQTVNRSKAALRESQGQRLSQLRRPGDRVSVRVSIGSRALGYRKFRTPISGIRNRPRGQRRPLQAWEYPLCIKISQSGQPQNNGASKLEPGRVAVFPSNSQKVHKRRFKQRTDICQSETGSSSEAKELARYKGKVRTYDIVNAGPLNRFTVSNVLVHNCGYAGGVGALKQMGAEEEGLSEDEMQDIINKWRAKSPRIVKLWKALEQGAMKALKTGKTISLPDFKNIRFKYDGKFLTMQLPSGRKLFYVSPKFTVNRFGGESIKFMGMNQTTKKWEWIDTYSGKLAENLTQAVARDLLAVSMLRLDRAGFPIVMHVHDESVAEVPIENAARDLAQMEEIMGQPVDWAEGLPLGADGYLTPFYCKD